MSVPRAAAGGPADDAAGEQVHDEGGAAEPRPGRHVGVESAGGNPPAKTRAGRRRPTLHVHPHVGRVRVPGRRPRLLLPEKVIGYAMADNMRTDLVCGRHRVWPCDAAPTRRTSRYSTRGRGSQYTSQQFARHLEHHRIRPSVGRTGVCWDNAWAESFNATLKNERVHRMVYPTREKAINDVASWIELTYNHTRLHSTLGYRTPNEVEHELRSQKHAA